MSLLLWLLVIGACASKGDNPDSSEADTDTDVDTDTDADTDPGHTPNDPQPVRVTSLTGEVTFTSTLDGVPRCDLGVSLTLDTVAEPLSFAEALYAPVESTVVRNDGSKECETTPLVPEDVFFALHSPDPSVDLGLRYTPWLWDTGDDLYSYTVTQANVASELLATNNKDGDSPGSVDASPNWPPVTIAWQRDEVISISTGAPDWYDDCDEDGVPESKTDTLVGTEMVSETLDADAGQVDVWELDLYDSGTVSLRVATDDPALHPVLWVNQNDGCTLMEANGNVPCNDKDAATSCPAVELSLSGLNRQFVVRGAGKGKASYQVWYTLPGGGTPTLVEDDQEWSPDLIYRIETSGSIELTTEWK